MDKIERKQINAILEVLEAFASELHEHVVTETTATARRRKRSLQALERLRNLVVKGEE